MGFLFSVDVYVFIAMVVFLWLKIDKNCQKLSRMGIHENEWDFVAWNLKKLSERAAKYTAPNICHYGFKIESLT